MANGPNPLLVVRENLTPHIDELEERRARLCAELLDVTHELALARTLQQMLPPDAPVVVINTDGSGGQSTAEARA